jgi:hypothetical protein
MLDDAEPGGHGASQHVRTADSRERSLADSMKEWSSWILTFRRAYPL